MSANRRQRYGAANTRHYCQICNAWMGADKHSVSFHENGKKHQENVQKALLNKRQEKETRDSQQSLLEKTLRQVNAAANAASMTHDAVHYGNGPLQATVFQPVNAANFAPPILQQPIQTLSQPAPVKHEPNNATAQNNNKNSNNANRTSNNNDSQDREEWQSRKRQRQEERYGSTKDDDDDDAADDALVNIGSSISNKRYISVGEGVHECQDQAYLDGSVYGDIIEVDMPVQLWTGNSMASNAEKILPEHEHLWQDALVLKVSRTETDKVVDVSYLQSPDDETETIVRAVDLANIRIQLGADESIPDTVEEARLLAMGGEEIVVSEPQNAIVKDDPDTEDTGISGWTTVSVQRTTVRAQIQQERARARQEREAANIKRQEMEKKRQAIKLEEAKTANADDSALGAYDVYSQHATSGYKGVDIDGDNATDIVAGRKLASSDKPVEFKKPAFKKKKRMQSRRTTTSDD